MPTASQVNSSGPQPTARAVEPPKQTRIYDAVKYVFACLAALFCCSWFFSRPRVVAEVEAPSNAVAAPIDRPAEKKSATDQAWDAFRSEMSKLGYMVKIRETDQLGLNGTTRFKIKIRETPGTKITMGRDEAVAHVLAHLETLNLNLGFRVYNTSPS